MKRDRKKRRRSVHPRVIGQRRRLWKRIALGLVILLVILGIIIIRLGASFSAFSTNERGANSTKAFSQISPDVPLYVLIVGVDKEQPKQTNFIAVAAVNEEKQQLDFIMLPDNTKVESRQEKKSEYLRDIYPQGGISLLKAVVEDIFHIPVPFYAICTPDAFFKLMDMNGGLRMYVERGMYHGDRKGKTEFNIYQGYQRLNGENALGYVRYINDEGELARTLRQERFVKQLYHNRQQHWGITNMVFMYRFWHYVQSNIKTKDIAHLAYSFADMPVNKINFYILPGEMGNALDASNRSYWVFDPVEVQKLIGTTNHAIAPASASDKKTEQKNDPSSETKKN